MRNSEEMPMWARIYLQRFRRPASFDPPATELLLNQELGEWREETLIEVMAWMQNQNQDWGDFPNGKKLAIAYRAYQKWRYAPKDGVFAANDISRRESLFNECKKNILRIFRDNYRDGDAPVTAWQDIWDQICRPDDAGDAEGSKALERWAEENIGFDRSLTGLVEEFGEAIQKLSGAFRSRSAA